MMRTANDPLRAAERVHRRIVAASEAGPQLVFVDRQGRVDRCTLGSERQKALESRPDFFRRVAGVFDASATVPLLAAALREVRSA